MLNRILAESLLLLHFAFILFTLFGGFLVLRHRRWAWAHLAAVLEASLINLFSLTCPLTPLEQSFRRAAGQLGYAGGFVEHYIGPLVYPGGMPRQLELAAAGSVLAWNVLVYAVVFFLLRTRRR